MDCVNYQHQELANGRWKEMPLALQMGNVGSEVSRALKWKEKNKERSMKAVNRALELLDLSLISACEQKEAGRLREICRGREVLCDYFYGENLYHSTPENLMKYYNQFALMRGKNPIP